MELKRRGKGRQYSVVFLNGKLEVHDSRSSCCYAELYCRIHVSAGLLSRIFDWFFVMSFWKGCVGESCSRSLMDR